MTSSFNSLYWDFCFASPLLSIHPLLSIYLSIPFIGIFALHLPPPPTPEEAKEMVFQFPLLGFLLCIPSGLNGHSRANWELSIPFIGIFALHLLRERGVKLRFTPSFNSLYWDFCFASVILLGSVNGKSMRLSIPFIGIFALHLLWFQASSWDVTCLSIPFIGIFALHLARTSGPSRRALCSFNSLYWDFCFASLNHHCKAKAPQYTLSIPFIGIFALHHCWGGEDSAFDGGFQFPLLGFLLCIEASDIERQRVVTDFQFPLLGFLLCIRCDLSLNAAQAWLFQFPLLGFLLCINLIRRIQAIGPNPFQFPLLGFLLCISCVINISVSNCDSLSIPFIGIFALHRRNLPLTIKDA